MTPSDQQRTAEIWALADDDNLVSLMAWRLVRQRAESDGFNGLLASDFTNARGALDAMLADGAERIASASAPGVAPGCASEWVNRYAPAFASRATPARPRVGQRVSLNAGNSMARKPLYEVGAGNRHRRVLRFRGRIIPISPWKPRQIEEEQAEAQCRWDEAIAAGANVVDLSHLSDAEKRAVLGEMLQ